MAFPRKANVFSAGVAIKSERVSLAGIEREAVCHRGFRPVPGSIVGVAGNRRPRCSAARAERGGVLQTPASTQDHPACFRCSSRPSMRWYSSGSRRSSSSLTGISVLISANAVSNAAACSASGKASNASEVERRSYSVPSITHCAEVVIHSNQARTSLSLRAGRLARGQSRAMICPHYSYRPGKRYYRVQSRHHPAQCSRR